MIVSFLKILIIIGASQLVVFLIILTSYVIEKFTQFNLFIDHFTWKKSLNNAKILTVRDSVYYFIINLGVFYYSIHNEYIMFSIPKALFWLCIVFILTLTFREVHYKYQGVDFNKSDDDYT